MKKPVFALLILAALTCQGCAAVVGTVVGTTVGVGIAAVGTAASIGGHVIGAVIP
ncbi:MAG: hypothetical protein JWM33_736 [Caulobacteraceae bacterium]|nr:hypothetical protein [Caulobacteraceae bacterium]